MSSVEKKNNKRKQLYPAIQSILFAVLSKYILVFTIVDSSQVRNLIRCRCIIRQNINKSFLIRCQVKIEKIHLHLNFVF